MRFRSLFLAPIALASLAALHCGGATSNPNASADGGPGIGDPLADSGIGADGGPNSNPDAVGATTSSKVDILLVVDNSSSMADKANLLSGSIVNLLAKVAATSDVHLGVITSSLGTLGGDVCENTGPQNTLAHLSTMGPGGAPVASAATGVLAYSGGDTAAFLSDAQSLIQGVGETGCGLEAQLESTYRFLVQPDPWQSVVVDGNNQAQLSGTDATVLAQRKAFLRPDSLVVVLLLTDEDDSIADPLSVGGQGWAFMSSKFPGSPIFRDDGRSTTAPRASSACASDPGSPDCMSCGFAATCDATVAACQKLKSDPECMKNSGYFGPTEDSLNVRFQHMKQRYGIDPQFPLSRYVGGFTKQRVPDRNGEHTLAGTVISPYNEDGLAAKCTNPLFAKDLPSAPGDEICNLAVGPRGKDLVVFAVLGGVPSQLVTPSPDWTKILGLNPAAYDYSGIDVHMIQSTSPRQGIPGPSATRGDDGTDPINGRDWDTQGNDLEYACTFALPTPRMCTTADTSCDCDIPGVNPPLCGATDGLQTRAKAYPTTRELEVVKALGNNGVVGSMCAGAASFDATMAAIAARVTPSLTK
jgi:hypothetical protein